MKTVIVGGVAGGAGAAARLRRNDESAQIIVLEKGPHISFANCGLPYYVGGIIEREKELLLQTPERFNARFNVDVRVLHECLAVDTIAKTVTVKKVETGEVYTESYDKLILSPGASPVRPPIPGMENAFTLRNVPDSNRILQYVQTAAPRSCAVIGAGFIGLEMAENLAHKGINVSVIEFAPHVMGQLDMDMSHDVHNYLRANKINLYLNSKAASYQGGKVGLADGRQVEADFVILSVGVQPETKFLVGSGIVTGKRGEIIVNEYLETSAPDVYAVGDAISVRHIVNGRKMVVPLASPANKQARIVADNACGIAQKYNGAQGTAIAKVFDMTIALTGESEASLQAAGTSYSKVITYSPSNAGYYPGGEMMSVKILFNPASGLLLGAQIVGGKGVDKRIDVLATAIYAKLKVSDLCALELAYAPPFSSAKDPVNMAGYVANNMMSGKTKPAYVEEIEALAGRVTLIDARTPGEFRKGSIPGAVSIPLDEMRARLHEIDRSREVVVFCQSGQRSYNAEQILRANGFHTRNMLGGYRFYQAYATDR